MVCARKMAPATRIESAAAGKRSETVSLMSHIEKRIPVEQLLYD
jgi:hypothetical protein